MRHRLLPTCRVYSHLTHLANKLLTRTLWWHWVLRRVYCIVLGLLNSNHLHVWSDSLAHIVVCPFRAYSAHLWCFLWYTYLLLRLVMLLLLLSRCRAVLVNDLRRVTAHNDCLIHISLTSHAVIHRVCMLLGERLARRLLHVLMHELLLIEFLLTNSTCSTCFVNRLATEAAQVLNRLLARLLCPSLQRLLLK